MFIPIITLVDFIEKVQKLTDEIHTTPRRVFGDVKGLNSTGEISIEPLRLADRLSREILAHNSGDNPLSVGEDGKLIARHIGSKLGPMGYFAFVLDGMLRDASGGNSRLLTFEDVLKYRDQIPDLELGGRGVYPVNGALVFPMRDQNNPGWKGLIRATSKTFESQQGKEYGKWREQLSPRIFSGLVYGGIKESGWGPFKSENPSLELSETSRVIEVPDFLMSYASSFKYIDGEICAGGLDDTWLTDMHGSGRSSHMVDENYRRRASRGFNFIRMDEKGKLIFSDMPLDECSGILVVKEKGALEEKLAS